MKKILLLSTLAVALVYTSNAQQNKANNSTQQTEDVSKMEVAGIPLTVYVQGQTDQMTKDLGLSQQQASSVLTVNRNLAFMTSKAERISDRKQAAQAINDIAKLRREQYQKILTTQQFEQWSKTGARASR